MSPLSGARKLHWGAAAGAASVSFTVTVDLVRWLRPSLLTDPDPTWLMARLALALAVAAICVASAWASYRAVLALERTFVTAPLAALPFPPPTLALIAAGALLAGALLRLVALSELPSILFVDDASLLMPAMELQRRLSDFRDAIRPAPFGVPKIYGTVGVLYLELMRACLDLCGTTVLGLRLSSALGGVASLVTGALLGRVLLPRGGGALTGLVLAGLRWHLILSRWGWNMIALAPVVDAATLLLLRARRRESLPSGLAAGLLAGVGAHIYLASWSAGAALLAVAAWPWDLRSRWRRVSLAAVFALGFAAAAAPLFFFAEGRPASYWIRTRDHNVVKEMRYRKSAMPIFAAAADSLAGPWFGGDPLARNDLPGRSRLGLFLGLAFGASCLRALLRPGEELSALLLAHAAAGLASSVAGGESLVPNGCRYAYLTSLTSVAVGAGALSALSLMPQAARRTASLLLVGALAVLGALGARDALVVWPSSRAYYDDIFGQDTLIARAALRWERVGPVSVDLGTVRSPLVLEAIRRFRLDPEEPRRAAAFGSRPRPQRFRIVRKGTAPAGGEKVVELLTDPWGRGWGLVLGSRAGL